MESIEPNKIEVGDIFSTAERDVENKPLIMITDIIQDGKPGIKNAQTRWGTKQYESDGYSLNYKVSLDNGKTWKYEDGEGHYVDTGWIGELIKMGHWSLEQKNMDLGGDFFDSLTESEEDEFEWLPDQGEIGLKVRVNEKPFHIKNPVHRQDEGIFKSRCSWSGCYEIVGEEIFTGIDCYIIKLDDHYSEVYFPKKAFLEKDFCGIDDTGNRLFESEKDEVNSNCVGINLSNLTTDEKIKVLEKLEQVYNTFVGFSRYAWVDQIQYLVTDFTTPVTMPLKGKRNQCGRWLNYVPENAYKEETDSYEVPVSMDGTKVRWSKEIDGREFLNMSFIDDTNKLFESEKDDFGWANEIINEDPIKVGDVFYIVDTNFGVGIEHPIDYRPENVRYIFFVTKIYKRNGDFRVEYKHCNNQGISYDPRDFNPTQPRCHYGDIDTIKYKDALNLVNEKYWRPIGNNGYHLSPPLYESENKSDYSWLLNQSMLGLKFYEPKEFETEGTIYTVVKEGKNRIKVDWVNTISENWPDQTTKLDKIDFIKQLNDNYLVLMPESMSLDDTINIFDKLNESEDDFGWAENLVTEPFHYQLMRDNPRKPVRLEDVKYIMFNPPVEVGDKRFNKIAYFLEDNDYYPDTLESFGKKTSYIEITKWIKRTINVRQNGRWNIGPELSEQELYNFSQTENNGKYWAEEFIFVDDDGNPINFLQNPFEF